MYDEVRIVNKPVFPLSPQFYDKITLLTKIFQNSRSVSIFLNGDLHHLGQQQDSDFGSKTTHFPQNPYKSSL